MMRREDMDTSDELMPLYGSRERLLECSELQGAVGGCRVLDDQDDFDIYVLVKDPGGQSLVGPPRYWHFAPRRPGLIYSLDYHPAPLWLLVGGLICGIAGYSLGYGHAEQEFRQQAFRGVEISEFK